MFFLQQLLGTVENSSAVTCVSVDMQANQCVLNVVIRH
jgi:hypothetical protein